MIIEQIEAIGLLTKSDYKLVICDDGSSDNTVSELKKRSITVLGGRNKGIAWNKNRGLFYLTNIVRSKTIILMDDDVIPTKSCWDLDWIYACDRVGHINFIPPHYNSLTKSREKTPEKLGIGGMIGGMIMAQSADALASVGYMDTRFGRYGHEHSDFSFRFLRSGFGGFYYINDGIKKSYFYLIDGGVNLRKSESHGNKDDLERNAKLLAKLAGESIYRAPWQTDGERMDFLSEFGDRFVRARRPMLPTTFIAEEYKALHPDVGRSTFDPLLHYIRCGEEEGRKLPS